ncbi:MAG: class I SAM-dependent methyltransferase [Thermoplasmata archaeon]|nr:class I SAM-dependent methyltransferase [Thermoplasmata archaeon]
MSAPGASPDTPKPPYSLTARVYDDIYAGKDYGAEARQIRALIRRYGPPRAQTLLDVACGTGSHLAYLSRWFAVAGVDAAPGMLRVAHHKLPRARFVEGRMESFDLGERFDVITCLFSAIAYVRSPRDLARTFQNFTKHLNPGGVAIVEPFFTPAQYRAGEIHLGTYGSPKFPIARMNVSKQRGNRAIMDMHHLVGTPEGVHHWVEHHDLGMFEKETYLSAFRASGFRAHFLKKGLLGDRGLYVAVLRPNSD